MEKWRLLMSCTHLFKCSDIRGRPNFSFGFSTETYTNCSFGMERTEISFIYGWNCNRYQCLLTKTRQMAKLRLPRLVYYFPYMCRMNQEAVSHMLEQRSFVYLLRPSAHHSFRGSSIQYCLPWCQYPVIIRMLVLCDSSQWLSHCRLKITPGIRLITW